MHYLLVLAGDPEMGDDKLGPNTIRRCLGVLEYIQHHSLKPQETTFVFAAGRGATIASGPTVARLMREYLQSRVPGASFLVNDSEYSVWSTLAEMRWAAKMIPRDSQVLICGNWLQLYRVRLIGWWFTPQLRFSTLPCGESQGHVLHEMLAYSKLLVEKLAPSLEKRIEDFRRRGYHLR